MKKRKEKELVLEMEPIPDLEDECRDEATGVKRFKPDMEKIERKMKHLPTLEGLLAEKDPHTYTAEQLQMAVVLAVDLVERNPQSDSEMVVALKHQMKKYKSDSKKSFLLAGYKKALSENRIQRHAFIESYLISKAPRSQSGVLVVTVFTSAYPEVDGKVQNFSCKWNCYYCPNEPGQPRSYLLNEPGVRRANRLEFNPIRQFDDRVSALVAIGHPPDKVELLVLGGTWESYPEAYRIQFIRDLFYAANTFHDDRATRRQPFDLLQEQLLNESAACKIIGLTLETRPDTIDTRMIAKLRQLGCTRVQIGVQHTNDDILLAVNRQATRDDTVRAIKLLKESCFKVDMHLMPDLPGATPALDKAMFDDVLYSEDLQADQWKIYPCQTTPHTVIKQWYEEGKYQPYGMDNLIDVLLYAKRRVHPWIRLNRVIRDIPIEYVLAGVERANLRQLLEIQMKKEGKTCQCIRCREVKGDKQVAEKLAKSVVVCREFKSSGGKEIFISVETPDQATLFGFLRLRFNGPNPETPFPELLDCALIRELHVYGNLVPVPVKKTGAGEFGHEAQHSGVGKRLLQRAEILAMENGYQRIAVISGVGVRNYYRKRGYVMHEPHRGGFLIKQLSADRIAELKSSLNGETLVTGVSDLAKGSAQDVSVAVSTRSWWTNQRQPGPRPPLLYSVFVTVLLLMTLLLTTRATLKDQGWIA